MSAKTYWLTFGQGDPRSFSGLTPTFLYFFDNAGHTLAPPTITEIFAGSGAYGFSYTISLSQSIFFLASSVTTFANVNDGFVKGVLDPVLAVDQQLTSFQLGLSGLPGLIGTPADSYGTTSMDPTTLFGYAKRNLEFNEGDQYFAPSSGLWQIYNRTSLGTTTLLRDKTLSNQANLVTKTGL